MIAIKLDSMVFYDVGRKLEIEMNELFKTNNPILGASKVIPMIVNYAFSDELALKYILAKNSIEFEKCHKLIELFLLLPQEIIDYFIIRISSMLNLPKESVLVELSNLSNSFVEWRYFYEGNTKNTNVLVLSRFSYLLNQVLKYDGNIEEIISIVY